MPKPTHSHTWSFFSSVLFFCFVCTNTDQCCLKIWNRSLPSWIPATEHQYFVTTLRQKRTQEWHKWPKNRSQKYHCSENISNNKVGVNISQSILTVCNYPWRWLMVQVLKSTRWGLLTREKVMEFQLRWKHFVVNKKVTCSPRGVPGGRGVEGDNQLGMGAEWPWK